MLLRCDVGGLRAFIVFGFVSGLTLTGCGGDPSSSTTKVIGGSSTEESDYPEVVIISSNTGVCSASLISPTTVLTAAHCLEDATGPVRVGDHVSNRYFLHPGYQARWWEHDVAVVAFDVPIGERHLVLAAKAPTAGDDLEIVGYGFDSLYGGSRFGTKRVGRNRVVRVGNGRIEFRGADVSDGDPATHDDLNAPGDSGGPMLVGGVQVGVSSSISVEARGAGRNGYYTDLNYLPNRRWLDGLALNDGLDIAVEE